MIHLSRRERQILDVLYRAGKASAQEIHAALPDAPSYSAVRALLRILEEKGHIRHEEDGPRYVYSPCVPAGKAKKQALKHLVETFFEGSAGMAAAALLDPRDRNLSTSELDRLAGLIDEARRKKEARP